MDMKMLIKGQLVGSDNWVDVTNRATEAVFARVPHASGTQLDEGAAAAQVLWAET